ncbi:hypothetical protein GGQ99_005107 [Aminobacter niigataensis]|uniref:Transposase n=1 Tax=Aminobacter niigataensis TaxID=83265 RepID=A0ABR6L937_9HYPH|nr:hypothetical protein [Aminobacter niigataensis]MBB4653317.1 hypothetical protein [Aminobacter niigataensis]
MAKDRVSEEPSTEPHGSDDVRPVRSGYTGLDAAGRRSYHAQKQRERRARLKEAMERGKPRPTIPAIRAALADAAAVILRENLQGADLVHSALDAAFNAPGIGSTVSNMVRASRLPSRLLPEQWRPPAAISAGTATCARIPDALQPRSTDQTN